MVSERAFVLTHKLVLDSLDLPLQCICFAERVDEELRKSVKGSMQLVWPNIKVIGGAFL